MSPIFLIDYLAGVAGGVAVVLVGHPFDTMKTRLQTAPEGFYRGTLDATRKTFKKEGLSGFYSGVASPLIGQMFFRAASFSCFHYSFHQSEKLFRRTDHDSYFAPFFRAGAITGFFIAFIETPIDLIKTKFQVQVFRRDFLNRRSHTDPLKPQSEFTTVGGCIRYIVRSGGPRALWQGLFATMLRNVPANSLFFPVNEIVKIELAKRNNINVSELQLQHRLAAGACAGLGYWMCTYPLDVIKGTIQAKSYDQYQRSTYIETGEKNCEVVPSGGVQNFSASARLYVFALCN